MFLVYKHSHLPNQRPPAISVDSYSPMNWRTENLTDWQLKDTISCSRKPDKVKQKRAKIPDTKGCKTISRVQRSFGLIFYK